MPRNISPAIVIAGLPGKNISTVSFKNIQLQHPGGGNPVFAEVSLDSLDKIPELANKYPEFSMFRELPAWAIFARHADHLIFNNVVFSCQKNDYRTPIVLDDVHDAQFISLKITQVGKKKKDFYLYKCNSISK